MMLEVKEEKEAKFFDSPKTQETLIPNSMTFE